MTLTPRPAHRGVLVLGVVALLAAAPRATRAQALASEHATVSQTISGTTITIAYYRPSMRGRDTIFGTQVPWGEVWTPGANWVTTLAVDKPITLDGYAVAPGKYGVWIQVRRDSSWIFGLHRDTLRFHVRHPRVSDMLLSFPVTPTQADAYRETLTFLFEHVRMTGALLQLWWGRTLVSVPLGVETPGLRLDVDAATAARYVGRWTGRAVGPDSSPEPAEFHYDSTAHRLLGSSGAPGSENYWEFTLLPRSEGVFLVGTMVNGDLAEIGADTDQTFVEFEFDRGRAVRFAVRGANDQVYVRGVRADSVRR